MSKLDDLFKSALFTGDYVCRECGASMEFEDPEYRSILICPSCGHSCSLDYYDEEDDNPPYEYIYHGKN